MLTKELNDLISQVGPGTAAGNFMRRYWHPVSLTREVTPGSKPKQVRILGEDLVLFRDDQGRPGLLGLHCSHRCVSLAYGRPEDGGIRCSMHGWLYDVTGRCLDQPAEPDEHFKDHIRHLAYPCEDLGGLIFAYMGPPEKQPLLPRYEALVRADGTRQCTWWPITGNYLQHLEGAWDNIHAGFLHTLGWSEKKHAVGTAPKPQVKYMETEYGLIRRSDQWQVGGVMGGNYGYFFMPAGWQRLQTPRQGQLGAPAEEEGQKFLSWFVPVDDGHTLRYQVGFAGLHPDGTPHPWRPDGQLEHPGADLDYGRDFEHVDSISGIDPSTPELFRAQDTMANETQGYPCLDRSREHLGAHDHILTAMRMMILKGITHVEKDLDPKHVIRDPALNDIVYLRSADQLEQFGAESAGHKAGKLRDIPG